MTHLPPLLGSRAPSLTTSPLRPPKSISTHLDLLLQVSNVGLVLLLALIELGILLLVGQEHALQLLNAQLQLSEPGKCTGLGAIEELQTGITLG